MVPEEHVVWAYRKFLGRDPENFEVVMDWAIGHRNVAHLVQGFVSTPEFMDRDWEAVARRDFALARRKKVVAGLAGLLAAIAFVYIALPH